MAYTRVKKILFAFLNVGFLFLGRTSFSYAQGSPKLTVNIKFVIEDGNLDNALITIEKNSQKFKTIDPQKAKMDIDLDYGNDYLFTFSKKIRFLFQTSA